MASRIEEEYARRIMAQRAAGSRPKAPMLTPPPQADAAVEIGPVEEIISSPDPTIFGDITMSEAPPSPPMGEMMVADAKSQVMSPAKRRRMRRMKLEEALRAQARAPGEALGDLYK